MLQVCEVDEALLDNAAAEVAAELDRIQDEWGFFIDYGVLRNAGVVRTNRCLLVNELPQFEVGFLADTGQSADQR